MDIHKIFENNLHNTISPWSSNGDEVCLFIQALKESNVMKAMTDTSESSKKIKNILKSWVDIHPKNEGEKNNLIQARLLSIQIDHENLFKFLKVTELHVKSGIKVPDEKISEWNEKNKQSSIIHDLLKEGEAWSFFRKELNQDSERVHWFAKQMHDAQERAMNEAEGFASKMASMSSSLKKNEFKP